MNATPPTLIVRFLIVVAAAALMYFVPALAAVGAVVYLVRAAVSTAQSTPSE